MANPRSRAWQGRTSQGALGDAGPYTAAQWAETWRTMIGTGANYANRGVIRGVDSEFIVSANSPAAQNVLVGTGAALVQGRWVYYDEVTTVSVASNASGSTRNDIIVLESDYTLQTVRIDIVQGTPAAGVPALTQNLTGIYQIPLAYLTLASGFTTVTASMITDWREYANIPDAVGYVATNSSGSTLENGTVVVPTGTQSFTTTTTLTAQVAGVLERRTANGAVGRIITQGIFSVICEASVSVGDFVGASSTAGQAEVAGSWSFARVLVANTGAGTRALCYVNVNAVRKPPACKVYRQANQVLGGAGVLLWTDEYYDNNDMHSTSVNTSRITCIVPGIYNIKSRFETGATSVLCQIRVNGAQVDRTYTLGGGGFNNALLSCSMSLAVGDYVEIYVEAACTVSVAGTVPFFAVEWVSTI